MLIRIDLPLQTGYIVETQCGHLLKQCELNYGVYAHRVDVLNKNDNVISVNSEFQQYKITFNNKMEVSPSAISTIRRLIFDNSIYNSEILAFHGAAVEYRNRAYVFLASTTTGKSTLSSYLTSIGLGYISDDCVLIDKKSHFVYPCTTPIHLRKGGLDVLRFCGHEPSFYEELNDGIVERFVYTPANFIRSALPLEHIFFISRSDSENSVEGLNSFFAVQQLLFSPITHYEISTSYLKDIANIVNHTRCDKLVYCDLDFVAETVYST